MTASAPPTILISILNWNTAESTSRCVNSLLNLQNERNVEVTIVVVDNGSMPADWDLLQQFLLDSGVNLLRQSKNLGFAGGHNISMKMALEKEMDFVWLVNSDAEVRHNTLDLLIGALNYNPNAGAVSPLIVSLTDESTIAFCGARHDWANLASVASTSIEETRQMEHDYPSDMWLMGAAILLRVEALRQVGMLEERYFAYYEDNDLCARLSKGGWHARMVPDAVVLHSHPVSRMQEKPAYYFYLMARNSFLFWHTHTPKRYRTLIRVKLIDRAILVANRLHHHGYFEKTAACLLGVYDGQRSKTGKWNLARKVPFIMTIARCLLRYNHSRHFRPGDA